MSANIIDLAVRRASPLALDAANQNWRRFSEALRRAQNVPTINNMARAVDAWRAWEAANGGR